MSDYPHAGDPNGPLGDDAVFAAIVAGYHTPGHDPSPPSWPAAEDSPSDHPTDHATDHPSDHAPPADYQPYALPQEPFRSARESGPRDYEPAAESEHYVPPPPGARQPTHPTTRWGVTTVGLGLILLIAPWLLGVEQTDGISFIGVGAILTGIGLLVSRLRSGNEPENYDGDDGAVV